MDIPSKEDLNREGWDTPAAEWLRDEANRLGVERSRLLAECKRLSELLRQASNHLPPDSDIAREIAERVR